MRAMSHKEIIEFIKSWTWGTLIAIEGNRPYAVELSYGSDDDYIYCGSRPGGRMARCILKNPAVAFKICDSDWSYGSWRAVIVEGVAERQTEHRDILLAVRRIALQRGLPESTFDAIAGRICNDPESNSLRIPLKTLSGVISR